MKKSFNGWFNLFVLSTTVLSAIVGCKQQGIFKPKELTPRPENTESMGESKVPLESSKPVKNPKSGQ